MKHRFSGWIETRTHTATHTHCIHIHTLTHTSHTYPHSRTQAQALIKSLTAKMDKSLLYSQIYSAKFITSFFCVLKLHKPVYFEYSIVPNPYILWHSYIYLIFRLLLGANPITNYKTKGHFSSIFLLHSANSINLLKTSPKLYPNGIACITA